MLILLAVGLGLAALVAAPWNRPALQTEPSTVSQDRPLGVIYDPAWGVSGRVRSLGGRPLAGVLVVLGHPPEARGDSVFSDSTGCFSIILIGEGRMSVTFVLRGFKSLSLEAGGGVLTADARLARLRSSARSSGELRPLADEELPASCGRAPVRRSAL